ncbi:hypothetical protein KC345_g7039 [Hortaea werneckii]|nr:hypothetical protein KC345_g7039 [Hortaea werneckii]
MSAQVLPLDAANAAVSWSVVNGTGSATIDAVSGELTAVSSGTITVEAAAADGSGITGSVQLTILEVPTPTPIPTPTPTPAATEKPDPEPVLVSGITVAGASSVQAGTAIQMTAAVLPAEAAEQAVVWSVEQGTGTAAIDVHGTLTGISAGVVNVKATAVDGSAVYGTKEVEIIAVSGGGGSLPAPTQVPTAAPTPSATTAPAAPTSVATPALTSVATPVTTPAPTPSATAAPTPVPVPVQAGVQFVDKVVDIASVLTNLSHKIEEAQTNPAPLKFTDTSAHWADSTVGVFVKLGVVTGYQDGGFHPDASITRAEFATVLAKVFGLSGNAAGSTLTDISGHWAEDSIRALQQKGVISGYQNGTFLPNREISRAEIIAMISKIINLNSVNAAASSGFSDLDKTWNKEQIAQAAAAGIISGEGNGLFLPAKQASRAEALTIVLRVLETNPELKSLLDTLK